MCAHKLFIYGSNTDKTMLQTIREKLTGWFAIFILGAIALTLVLTFGNIDTGVTGLGAAASVNGEDISMRDFRRVYQGQRQQWESNYRSQIPAELAQGMADQVIQSLVRNRVVAQHARSQGYRVNDSEVKDSIWATSAFHVGGQFSQPAYEQLLASQGMSPQRFEFEQRQNMEMSQFIEGVGYSAFYTPAEFRRYIELDGETRDVEYLLLPAVNWADKIEISAEQVASYYELNQQAFMSEESAILEYIELDYEAILAEVSVSSADAEAYYDANPQEFAKLEDRDTSHILITFGDDEAAAAEQAAELKARLDAGEDFAVLAAEYSADTGSAGNGGSLGWLSAEDAPSIEFEDALFTLSIGEVSEPVRTEFGFHLIRLDGLRAGKSQDFADVKDDLMVRLSENEAADLYADRIDELDERSLESLNGLAPVAEALGVELGRVENFTRSGGLPLGFTPDLVSAVFSLEVLEDGENSPVIDMGEGRAAVVHVVEYKPSEILSLEIVSDAIEQQLRGEASISRAAMAGSELAVQLNSGVQRDAVALPAGVEWQKVEGIRRGEQDIPVDLSSALFSAPKPEAMGAADYSGLLLASGDFAVYTITASRFASPEFYGQEDRDLRKQQLAGRLGGSQATALVEKMVTDASVGVVGDLLGLEDNLP
jgi:peptidyl-prolyl cis-trans isomerase D